MYKHIILFLTTLLILTSGCDDLKLWSDKVIHITFASDRDGNQEIYVMKSDGSYQTNITNNVSIDGQPKWSSDGSKITFETDRVGNNEIYVMNRDGSNPVNISNNSTGDLDPSWTNIAIISN